MDALRALVAADAARGVQVPRTHDDAPHGAPDRHRGERADPSTEPFYAGVWKGRPIFRCPECTEATTTSRAMAAHVGTHRPPAPDALSLDERASRLGIILSRR